MLKQKVYYEMVDSLTVILGTVCLFIDGTIGGLDAENKKILGMAERHAWRLTKNINDLMGVKFRRLNKKLRGKTGRS